MHLVWGAAYLLDAVDFADYVNWTHPKSEIGPFYLLVRLILL